MRKKVLLAILLLASLGLVAWADVMTSTITSDADTNVRDALGTYGSDVLMYIFGSTTANYMGYVRFDLNPLAIDTISSATLKMTVSGGAPRNDTLTTGRYAPHGLLNIAGNTPQNWDEATLNQGSTGAEVNWTTRTINMTNVVNLDGDVAGNIETLVAGPGGAYAAGTTLSTTGVPLVDFLNARADDDGLVTFIINGEMNNNRGYGLGTRENLTPEYRPQLTLTYTTKGASTPQPPSGSKVNLYISQLSWTNSESYPKCDVYFGTEPNLLTMDKLSFTPAVTSVNIEDFPSYSVPLAEGTYYWRVDCYKGDPIPSEPNLPGRQFWNFIATPEPLIVTNPEDQFKFAGETAVFTVAFSSVDPITYAWYRSTDNANNTDADDTQVGTDSSTLTLSNVSLADEGYYYCKAANPRETRSATARFSIKRQYAHWTLDGNADDSSGNNLHGTLYGSPAFTSDVLNDPNKALAFDGADDYIDEPNGFSDFSPGMTISLWAKPAAAGNFARFIDFGNGAPSDNIFFGRSGTAANLILAVHIGTAAGSLNVVANNVIVLNEWQMFVGTVDESRNVVLYKNGLPVQTGLFTQKPNIVTRTINYVGRSNWTADAMYNGALDDIQIWNYAKSADDIANLYSDTAGNFCRTRPTYDWDSNCKVDLPDFASIAAQWLDCGLYPNCP